MSQCVLPLLWKQQPKNKQIKRTKRIPSWGLSSWGHCAYFGTGSETQPFSHQDNPSELTSVVAPNGWNPLFCYPSLTNVHPFFILKHYFHLQFAKCLSMPHLKTVPWTKLLYGRQINYLTAILLVGCRCWTRGSTPPTLPFAKDLKALQASSQKAGHWWRKSQLELESDRSSLQPCTCWWCSLAQVDLCEPYGIHLWSSYWQNQISWYTQFNGT